MAISTEKKTKTQLGFKYAGITAMALRLYGICQKLKPALYNVNQGQCVWAEEGATLLKLEVEIWIRFLYRSSILPPRRTAPIEVQAQV